MAETQTRTKAAPKITSTAKVATAPDFVAVAKKTEDRVLSEIEKNPIYNIIIEQQDVPKEQRIAKVIDYLTTGLQDGTAKDDELDKRRQALVEFNTFVQVVRKQLGAEQAKEITSKAYADFQRIVNETTNDIGRFQDELAPLGKLSALFGKFGADGNIVEKINLAREQKRQREIRLVQWKSEHLDKLSMVNNEIAKITVKLSVNQKELADKSQGMTSFFHGRAVRQLEADIQNLQTDLDQRQQELATITAEAPPIEATNGADVEQVDEEILELQNIGGDAFKLAVTELREHTEEALAKISVNFDEATTGLNNTRESFINMDRNCGDANYALSVLEVAVQKSEETARQIAQSIIAPVTEDANDGMAALDRMEKERRGDQILAYTSHLTTFLKDVGVAVASLRSGQAVIKNILRMNALALESANTHKVVGIANTADAVTITIGTIIEVVNRAASRALADGLTRMRGLAEEGNARLSGGTYESLQQQNEQLESFVDSVENLRNMTTEISTNSIDLLKKQFELVRRMREESGELANATTDAERTQFAARAGTDVDKDKKAEKPDAPKRGFGLRVG